MDVVIIDFDGSPFSSRMSFLADAVKRLVSGEIQAVATIGIDSVPLEQFTNDAAEKAAAQRAREKGSIRILHDVDELQGWLDSLGKPS